MAINTDPIEFDPNLTIPLGLKHANYQELEVTEDDSLDVAVSVEFIDDAGDDTTGDDTDDEALDAPSYMTIVSQTVRTAPDGTQVVDVVLDIEDVIGAVKYDVRVTK